MNICSFVPGATEIVAALGLADHLVGVSHECDFPPEIRHRPVMVRPAIDQNRMTSPEIDRTVKSAAAERQPLYRLDEALFHQARPDVVITQDVCHVCAVTPSDLQRAINSLPQPPQVVTLNDSSLEDVLTDVERIGAATNTASEARALSSGLRHRLEVIRRRIAYESVIPTVVCLEWLDPFYVGGHWVPEMVWWAGGQDVLGTAGAPSVQITWEQLSAASPDVIIIMPCGFSIARTREEMDRLTTHPDWRHLPAVQQGRVFAVEASAYFSRPGPRLIDGVEILAALCHPSKFGDVVPAGAQRIDVSP